MNRLLLSLLFLPGAASAQIFADFETSEGCFSIELDFNFSPQAAANFIRLAEGSVPWADSVTGQVFEETPFYNGLVFHETQSRQLVGFGSRTGDGVDDAGWVFQDDFRVTGFSQYVAFMDNRDADKNPVPNNNGSRVVISIPQVSPCFEENFTQLGTVPAAVPPGCSGSGYDTIDAISEAPNNSVTITSVTIRRVGPAAMLFNENLQRLPNLSPADLTYTKEPDGCLYVNCSQEAGSVCRIWNSDDLMTWTALPQVYNYPGKSPFGYKITAKFMMEHPNSFFRGAEVNYPRQPSLDRSLNSARIQCDFEDTLDPNIPIRIQYFFNAAGIGGTWSMPSGGGGDFTVEEFTPVSPFSRTMTIVAQGLPTYQYLLYYDRDPATGETEQVSRLGGLNLSAPNTPSELKDGTWIFLPGS